MPGRRRPAGSDAGPPSMIRCRRCMPRHPTRHPPVVPPVPPCCGRRPAAIRVPRRPPCRRLRRQGRNPRGRNRRRATACRRQRATRCSGRQAHGPRRDAGVIDDDHIPQGLRGPANARMLLGRFLRKPPRARSAAARCPVRTAPGTNPSGRFPATRCGRSVQHLRWAGRQPPPFPARVARHGARPRVRETRRRGRTAGCKGRGACRGCSAPGRQSRPHDRCPSPGFGPSSSPFRVALARFHVPVSILPCRCCDLTTKLAARGCWRSTSTSGRAQARLLPALALRHAERPRRGLARDGPRAGAPPTSGCAAKPPTTWPGRRAGRGRRPAVRNAGPEHSRGPGSGPAHQVRATGRQPRRADHAALGSVPHASALTPG